MSYHEFEPAFGELRDVVVADSYDIEILQMNPLFRDELGLKSFMERESLAVPAAFTRYWIDVVLRKPDGSVPPLPEPTTLGFAGFAGFEQAIEVPADARELVVEVVAPAAAGSLAVSDDQRAELHFPLSEGRHYHRVPLGDGTRSVRLEAVRDDRGGPDAAHVTYLHAR